MSLLIVGLDVTIVNVALPAIHRSLHSSFAGLQWTIDAYTLVIASLLMLAGSTADRIGRKRVFIVGLTVFSLGSLLCTLASTLGFLIAARVLQAIGGSMLNPVAMSIIRNVFDDPRERAQAIGVWGAMIGISMALGPIVGGALVDSVSWRAVFLVNVPVGLAAALLAPRVITVPAATATTAIAVNGTNGGRRRLDVPGAVLITAAVALAVFAISQGDVLGWTSPLVLGAALIAAGAAGGFVAAETRHPAPLVRPRLLLRPGLRDGAMLAFLLGVWNGGELLVLSLYLQQRLGFSPLATGLIIAPQGLAGFTMGFLGPRLAARLGVRRVLVLAGAAATIGFAVLTRLPAAGYNPLLIVMVLVGAGGAGTAFGSIVLASRELADDDQGLAGGVINTSRQVGAAVGTALLPAVADAVRGISGDRAAMLAATVVALAATAVSWHAARRARVGADADAGAALRSV
jgi:EmrB/QacA subfamily drug resistance transporter